MAWRVSDGQRVEGYGLSGNSEKVNYGGSLNISGWKGMRVEEMGENDHEGRGLVRARGSGRGGKSQGREC